MTIDDNQTRENIYWIASLLAVLLLYLVYTSMYPLREEVKLGGTLVYLGITLAIIFVSMLIAVPSDFSTMNMFKTRRQQEVFWTSTHFLFYFFLAYFLRNKWIIIILLQFVWEITENILNQFLTKWFGERTNKKVQDVIANSLGYLAGNIFFNAIEKPSYDSVWPEYK